MTEKRKIDMMRAMLDERTEDEYVLSVYLQIAADKILNRMYPYMDNHDGMEVPDRYVMTQLNISCYLYAKRGAEGQIQHIENGIHRNFGSSDVPADMLAEVVPYCKAIV